MWRGLWRDTFVSRTEKAQALSLAGMGKVEKRAISERELRLTAAVYARLGVLPYLREHGGCPTESGARGTSSLCAWS